MLVGVILELSLALRLENRSHIFVTDAVPIPKGALNGLLPHE